MTSDLILSTLANAGRVTAYEAAALLKCTHGEFLAAYHNLPWLETDMPCWGTDRGFVYWVPAAVDPNRRMKKEVKAYHDGGYTKAGPLGWAK